MKYVSCDIETLGLDKHNDSLLQIALIIDEIKENVEPKSLSDLPKLLLWVDSPIKGHPKALEMHIKSGVMQKWIDADKNTPKECADIIGKFLFDYYPIQIGEKRIFAGKNFGSFDRPFIKKVLPFNAIDRLIHHRVIDPSVHFVDYKKDTELPDLQECKKRAQFESTRVSHDALDDAFDIIKLIRYHIYKKEFFRDAQDNNFYSTIWCPF